MPYASKCIVLECLWWPSVNHVVVGVKVSKNTMFVVLFLALAFEVQKSHGLGFGFSVCPI